MILHNVQTAKRFIEQAKTAAGLKITVGLLDKIYATGRKVAADFKATLKIIFDDHLRQWNYRAIPQPG